MTCFISLRTQFENLGDEVINSLLLRELSTRSDVVALTYKVPSWYLAGAVGGARQGAVELIKNPLKFYARFITSLFTRHTILIMSCGDVSDRGESALRDFVLRILLKLPNFELLQVGASLSAVSPGRAKLLRDAALSGCGVTVRDSESIDVLKAAGVDVEKIPDLAFLLPFNESTAHSRRLLLSFRSRNSQEWEEINAAVGQILELLPAEWEVVSTAQVARDIIVNMSLAAKFDFEFAELPQEGDRLPATLACYDGVDVVLSNRLHVLLLAASRGARAVALISAGETKVRGVMSDAELDILEFNNLTGEKVAAIIEQPKCNPHLASKLFSRSAGQLKDWFNRTVGTVRHEH